jgi:hypothetical protein
MDITIDLSEFTCEYRGWEDTDLQLVHSRCGQAVCSVDATDSLYVLVLMATNHVCSA